MKSANAPANLVAEKTPPSIGQFIRELQRLRSVAAKMGADRVVICLDYAHWEVISMETNNNPLAH